MKQIAILLVAVLLCPAFAFAADEKPVAVEETVAIAENATGDVLGEAVETEELYAPETETDIKEEAEEEIKGVKAEAKEVIEEIEAVEKEALKEAAM